MEFSTMPLLSTENLACGYGKQVVLRDICLHVEAGSCLAVLGANGSGKSTLLKTLCLGLPELDGQVLWKKTPLRQFSPTEIAKRIAYVPQGARPAFDFRVCDVVMMGRLPHSPGMSETSSDHDAVRDAMTTMDCEELSDRQLSTLSGGELQRVWIARALAQAPECLLFDEPTTHLDLAHQVELASHVQRLKGLGYGIVAALHDLNWANDVAETCLVVGDGGAKFAGTLDQLMTTETLQHAFGIPFTKTTGPHVKDRWFPTVQ